MINLSDKIPGANSFSYGEFVKSEVAIRKGILNIPNALQWSGIEKLAVNVLQPLRDVVGRIRISSGFRSAELNKEIGGSDYSNHCLGEAADIEPLETGITLLHVVKFIYNDLDFRTLILEYPDRNGWVHVDYREGGNIKLLKLKDATHNYMKVTLSELSEMY
jgi:hypothetical protein